MSDFNDNKALIFTVPDLCRTCYTCVRECPAKAIRILNGQAEVIKDRCIGCANCVKVCSQDAKVFVRTITKVSELLKSENRVAAIIAPSFAAEFNELGDHKILVGMVKALGFDLVSEVAFGADLVAFKYKEILDVSNTKHYISSDCPAIVSYIEKYYPQLVDSLAPVVSPMLAMSRVMRKKYGNDLKIVFIGPCVAKKDETPEIDEAITFRELKDMFIDSGINKSMVEPIEFDPPLGGKGAIFPISRGLLQTVEIKDTTTQSNILVAEGRINFQEAIKEFDTGLISNHHLELLCCDEGCIMGAGMSVGGSKYAKRTFIGDYVKHKLSYYDSEQWIKDFDEYIKLDLTREFIQNDQRVILPSKQEIKEVLHSMGKHETRDLLNCGACGYDSCEEHAIAIIKGLAENEMCLPYTIEKLHNYIGELNLSNEKLASVQQALKQSEKLAHMGQLSAGIAHELNNPLGVVIMYSNILLDEAGENEQMRKDLELIVNQSERCKRIVSGLLNFARKNQVEVKRIDVNKLIEQSLNSVIAPDNIKVLFTPLSGDATAMIDQEQMTQALTNLIKNAFDAMPKGGELNIKIDLQKDDVIFYVSDTGEGIPEENMAKLYEPFFTTKAIGKGTGLGLPTTYGIVKMHKGKITVTSNSDPIKGATGTCFKVIVPRNR